VESTEVLHRTQPKLAARLEKAVDNPTTPAKDLDALSRAFLNSYDVRFNVSETYPQIVSLKELSVCPERKGLASASSAPAPAPPLGRASRRRHAAPWGVGYARSRARASIAAMAPYALSLHILGRLV
jgi:hypothetical protein